MSTSTNFSFAFLQPRSNQFLPANLNQNRILKATSGISGGASKYGGGNGGVQSDRGFCRNRNHLLKATSGISGAGGDGNQGGGKGGGKGGGSGDSGGKPDDNLGNRIRRMGPFTHEDSYYWGTGYSTYLLLEMLFADENGKVPAWAYLIALVMMLGIFAVLNIFYFAVKFVLMKIFPKKRDENVTKEEDIDVQKK